MTKEPPTKKLRASNSNSNTSDHGNHNGDKAKPATLPAKQVVQLRFLNSPADLHESGAAGPHPPHLTTNPTYLHQIIPEETVHGYRRATVAIYVDVSTLSYWIDSHLTPLSPSSSNSDSSSDSDCDAPNASAAAKKTPATAPPPADASDAAPSAAKTPVKTVPRQPPPAPLSASASASASASLASPDDAAAAQPTNVAALLAPFVKAGLSPTRTHFVGAMSAAAAPSFRLPLNERNVVAAYARDGRHYAIYKERFFHALDSGAVAARDAFHDFHRRMCFLMFVHIDGASFIDDDDPRWEVFVTAEREHGVPVRLVGYATTYPFNVLTHAPKKAKRSSDSTHGEENGAAKEGGASGGGDGNAAHGESTTAAAGGGGGGGGGKGLSFADRIRVSQVIILPIAQRAGHGGRILNAIYDDAHRRNALEVTVEDPGEAFRILRDVTDLRNAYQRRLMDAHTRVADDDVDRTIESLRQTLLLTKGQARRCVEVHQFRHTDRSNEAEYKAYRLWVKRRLYHDNVEVLDRFTPDEKKEKLADFYADYEAEYAKSVAKTIAFVPSSPT